VCRLSGFLLQTAVKCTLLGSKTLNCCSSKANLIQWHFSAVGCIAAGGWLGATGLLDNLVKKVLVKYSGSHVRCTGIRRRYDGYLSSSVLSSVNNEA
jgi:hypothetical protein